MRASDDAEVEPLVVLLVGIVEVVEKTGNERFLLLLRLHLGRIASEGLQGGDVRVGIDGKRRCVCAGAPRLANGDGEEA